MDTLADLIGQAPGIARVRERIAQILGGISHSRRLPPILLQGETGTGKNLVAGLIHRGGPRGAAPFVDVNCAAIPEGLLEAELFGFERGAFTDARQAKAGLFQTADGGTIFLDEVARLSDSLQAKLLKVVEERTVRRLGGTRSEPVDVSIIAAANDDLVAAVAAQRFRRDLYHRLAVLTLRLPALRERRDDIQLLAEHFLARACMDYGLPPKTLTPGGRAALCAYAWPGNVRELANVMERAALLTEGTEIGPDVLDLPVDPGRAGTVAGGPSLDARVEAWERDELLRALGETGWNMARAAARLGITRGTIRYRVDKYGLEPPPRVARRRGPPAGPATSGGPAVVSPAAGVTWERRLVALLEATMLGRDPGREFDLVVQKVESFSGRIEAAAPGRIVAAFGLDPVEDAPRRAALAAMAIGKALARARPAPAGHGAITITIHADDCPVREISGRIQIDTGAMRRMTETLEGLGACADSDTVFVSAGARALLGRRFDVAAPAGRDGEVLGAGRLLSYQQDRFGVDGQPGPFVGRDLELATLGARWRQAREGRGQIVGVVGEPGIGKSRLLYEFRRTLDAEAPAYLEGRGESYGAGNPYLPVIDLLRRHLRVEERDEPGAVGQRLTGQPCAVDPDDASPLLALLAAPSTDAQWQALEPAERRSRTLDALVRFVLRLSQAQPVLLAVEDLHWIDTETQAFLDRLVMSVPAARLLVLVTYRPEYGHGWGGKSSYTQVRLDPLAPHSVEALLRSIVGDDVALRPLTRCLVERTEGNPFFLEESVRTLIETRSLVGERGAYRPAHDLHVLTVPPTVRTMLAARVARLPAEARNVLHAAAVVGKDVSRALLRAMVDVPEAALSGALATLQGGEFLHETRQFPEIEYTFEHALTHEVAYGELATGRQRELHLRMVDALERLHADRLAEQVERLAHHALAAEAWPRALVYCRQAGVKAAWRSAHREAVQHFEQALGAIRRLPETPATLAETLDLHFQLRWSLVPLGESAKLAASLREAERLAATLDDRHRLAEISQTMTHHLRMRGDCEGALGAGQRARAMAAALGDRQLEIRANYQIGLVHHQLGDYERAIGVLGGVVEALGGEWLHERFGEPSVLSVHARTWLGTALAEVGRFPDGIAACEEAIRIAENAKNAYSLMNAHLGLGTVYAGRGCVDRAIPLLERSVALCQEGNFQISNAASALGAALTLAGRIDEAMSLLQCSVEVSAANGRMSNASLYLLRFGHAQLRAGLDRHAEELAVRALDAARTYQERGHEAWALHLHGEIADSRDSAEAAQHYAQAVALGQSLEMRPLIARCWGKVGRLHRLMGRRDQARGDLDRAAAMPGDGHGALVPAGGRRDQRVGRHVRWRIGRIRPRSRAGRTTAPPSRTSRATR